MSTCRRIAYLCRVLPEACLNCVRWVFREQPQYYEIDGSYGLGTNSMVVGNPSTTKIDDLLHPNSMAPPSARHISINGEISPFDVGSDLDQFAPQLDPNFAMTVPTTSSEIPKRLVAALRGDASELRLLDGHKIIRGAGVKLIFDKLEPTQLRSICLAIRDNLSITSLELGCNNIGDNGVTIITECLRRCRHLNHLALWGNNIGDAGILSLGDLVGTCPLETLSLSNNEITDQGLSSLGFALSNCHTLRSLDLSVNSSISDNGLGLLVKAMKGVKECRLELLSVNNGSIGDLGAQFLGSWLSQPHCPLVSLDLSFNAVEDTGAQALAAALQVNTKLVELNLSGNLFTKVGMKCLLKSIDQDHCPNRVISMEDILTSQF